LEKRIPTGGGLGGGSSNAATTLVSLNELCGLGASGETLARLALELGSDVPFFLRPVPSFATGRGEKLEPIDFRVPFPILVVNPRIHVSTAEAYGACVPKKARVDLRKICRGEPRDFRKFRKRVANDFEETVFERRPAIRELKERLVGMGAVFASMSGSGSSVFGVFENLSAAQTARATLPKAYFAYIEDPE
jgi:4-diphosphocytidyl-2-C-methyl-D-erythritol kinase